MRLVTVALVVLLGLVHSELWLGRGGVPRLRELGLRLTQQRADNEAARARNERLLAEVRDLKEGLEMVEERARSELGMLKPDEILVQIASAPSVASLPVAAVPAFGPRPVNAVAARPRPAASAPRVAVHASAAGGR